MSWFTKTVEVEKVVEKVVEREVIGSPTKVSIYEAHRDEFYAWGGPVEKHLGYYPSCKAAFSEHPGVKVRELTGVVIRGVFFVFPEGTKEIKVTKPKRGKGKV